MLDMLALIVVCLAGLFLIGLGSVALVAPHLATRFLLGLAGSALAHYLEVGTRFVVGTALLLYAPQMRIPSGFAVLGWVLVVTTSVLAVLPWHWHRRFAEWAVPQALRQLRWIGVSSLLGGGGVLLAALG